MTSRPQTARKSTMRILDADEPSPVEVVRPQATSPFFFTCEHAGKRLPNQLGSLGLASHDLERHIAWDMGAAAVARRLSQRLHATLVLQTYSRLVVDCNRAPTADDFIPILGEDTEILGNLDVSTDEVETRAREIFHPYHDTITEALDRRDAESRISVLISVHSYTPVFLGESRPWHIGVLYQRDRRLADTLLDLFNGQSGLCVGDNQPYALTDERDYAVPVHGQHRGIAHVELEIRQDLIANEEGQDQWATRIADTLREGLGRLQESGRL